MAQAARVFLARHQQRDTHTQTEATTRCPACDELEALLAEVLAENESLRDERAAASAGRRSPPAEPEWILLSAPETGPTLGSWEPAGAATGATPVAQRIQPAAVHLGYMVLCTPDHLLHLRGHHRVDWQSLLRRLWLTPSFSKRGFHIRRYQAREQAEAQWTAQRLQLPFPVDPRREELVWGLNKDIPWYTAGGATPPVAAAESSGGAAESLEAVVTVPTQPAPCGFVLMLEPEVPDTSELLENRQDAWEGQCQKNKAQRYENEKKSKGTGRGKRGAASSQDEEWLSEPGDVGLDTGAAITAFPSPPSPPSPPSRSSQRHVRIWTAL